MQRSISPHPASLYTTAVVENADYNNASGERTMEVRDYVELLAHGQSPTSDQPLVEDTLTNPAAQQLEEHRPVADEFITKYVTLEWKGTMSEFADPNSSACVAKLHSTASSTDTDGIRLVLIETEVVTVHNTLPFAVGFSLQNTLVNQNTLHTGNKDPMAYSIFAETSSANVTNGNIIYSRRTLLWPRESLAMWDSLRSAADVNNTILHKDSEAGLWVLDPNSPLVEAAFRLKDLNMLSLEEGSNWGYVPWMNRKAVVFDAAIGSACYQILDRIVKKLPFEEVNAIEGSLMLADGLSFEAAHKQVLAIKAQLKAARSLGSGYYQSDDTPEEPEQVYSVGVRLARKYQVYHEGSVAADVAAQQQTNQHAGPPAVHNAY